MDEFSQINAIVDQLTAPFTQLYVRGSRIYWLYLLTAFTIAFYLILRHKQEYAKFGKNAVAVIFPKNVYRHRSSMNDVVFYYAEMMFQGCYLVLLFSSLTYVVSNFTEAGLTQRLPDLKGALRGKPGMGWAMTILLAVVADLALFLSHYLQHKIPWLWEFHKVHHSAEVMTPLTVFRMHPVDSILATSLTGLLSGSAIGCVFFFAGRDFIFYNVSGVNVFIVLFYLCGYNLRHSHIWWSFGPMLSRILISPAQHQIHHSSKREHFDKNLGFTFAFWDWAIGTLYVPVTKENITFGLGMQENEKFSTLWGLYLMPFINLHRQFQWKMLLEPKRYGSVFIFLVIVLPALYLNRLGSAPAQPPAAVFIEDMTWQEVGDAIEHGATRVLVPTGGTEQNGPHLILGKHNYIVRYTAGKIADRLGNTLVAPVIAYVPEGTIEPPEGHMKFAGTLSVSEEEFEAVLVSAVSSLKQHGFTTIALIGDSGGNQAAQQRVARQLSNKWRDQGVNVLHVSEYYSNNAQVPYLANNGLTGLQIGGHAGIRDTSELMAVHPDGVRTALAIDHTRTDLSVTGADGDASKASVLLGNQLLELKITAAVRQILGASAPSG